MGLLLFEASTVATTLVGEPVVTIFSLVALHFVSTRVFDDGVFFIFLGALCATLFAKAWKWKTKTDQLLYNCGEALLILIPTIVLFPAFISHWVRFIGSSALYFVVLQNWQVPTLLSVVYVLSNVGTKASALDIVTITTLALCIFFYLANKYKWI